MLEQTAYAHHRMTFTPVVVTSWLRFDQMTEGERHVFISAGF